MRKFDENMIIKHVPKIVVEKTRYNMEHMNMDLYDAFKHAVGNYSSKPNKHLFVAWFYDDYREYIPTAYNSGYLDFNKYPLRYKNMEG